MSKWGPDILSPGFEGDNYLPILHEWLSWPIITPSLLPINWLEYTLRQLISHMEFRKQLPVDETAFIKLNMADGSRILTKL